VDGSVRARPFPPVHTLPRISISRAAEERERGKPPANAGRALRGATSVRGSFAGGRPSSEQSIQLPAVQPCSPRRVS
jgi:hypothetical protein